MPQRGTFRDDKGREITLEWDGPEPTDSELEQEFRSAYPDTTPESSFGSNLLGSAGRAIRDTALGIPKLGKALLDVTPPGMLLNAALGGPSNAVAKVKEAGEIPGATMRSIGTRYGGLENIKKTAYEDPVGMTLDLASLLTLGGGMAARAPGLVGRAGRAAGAMGQAIDIPGRVIRGGSDLASKGLRKVAKSARESAIRVPEKVLQANEGFDIPRLVQETGLSLNDPTAVKTLQKQIADVGGQIEGLDVAAGQAGKRVPRAALSQAVLEEGLSQAKRSTKDAGSILRKTQEYHEGAITNPAFLKETLRDPVRAKPPKVTPYESSQTPFSSPLLSRRVGKGGKTEVVERPRDLLPEEARAQKRVLTKGTRQLRESPETAHRLEADLRDAERFALREALAEAVPEAVPLEAKLSEQLATRSGLRAGLRQQRNAKVLFGKAGFNPFNWARPVIGFADVRVTSPNQMMRLARGATAAGRGAEATSRIAPALSQPALLALMQERARREAEGR